MIVQTTFSRSLRTIEKRHGWKTAVFLLLPLLLLAAWLAWFFLATVPVYQTSSQATFTSASRLTAYFPPTALQHVQTGQAAQLRLDDFPWTTYGTVEATIIAVEKQVRDGLVAIELAIDDPNSSLPLQRGLTTQVEIETAQLAPIELLLQTVSQRLQPDDAN